MAHITPSKVKTLADLNQDVLRLIFGLLPNDELLQLSGLCRRFRNTLVPLLFRRVRWAPTAREFPPNTLWPHIQLFTLVGSKMREINDEVRARIVDNLHKALPDMKLLYGFIVDETLKGGIWSELLDALETVPIPFRLAIEAFWDAPPLLLPLRTSPLPLIRLTYPYAFMEDLTNGYPARRTAETFTLEENNLRVILEASAPTLASLSLPGELFTRSMPTNVRWDALRELYVTGFWPLSEESHGFLPAAKDTIVVTPASSTSAAEATERPGPEANTTLKAIAAPSTLPRSPEGMHSVTLAPPSPPKSKPSSSTIPSPSSDKSSLPHSRRSPMLSVLEAIPNLRIVRLRLDRHVSDAVDPPMIILGSPPRSPHAFLRNLIEFEATSLSNEDQTLGFLPSQLDTLSLRRRPFNLPKNTRYTVPRPQTVLKMLEHAHFTQLKTLRLWYMIETRDHFESDQALLSRLPEMFPLLEHLEICRLWEHGSTELEGL
ncbi:hypothetical protein C8F01DRAFT_1119387 [Mycena amicta]|nr:hypothetical protein C8F01DRAFT_1119387 [Mycena amicta]